MQEEAMLKRRHAALLLGFAVGLGPSALRANAQDINIVMALPSATLTFSSAFLAQDAGFFNKEGLKVTTPIVVGVGAANAVISGSADFTIGTGPVFLRAAARGQRMLAIANLIDRPLVELVLRKDVAAQAGITALKQAQAFSARTDRRRVRRSSSAHLCFPEASPPG
jgi:ABC-type nitrate/sulfonate/bicarbonate transport system substrate-binding protein